MREHTKRGTLGGKMECLKVRPGEIVNLEKTNLRILKN